MKTFYELIIGSLLIRSLHQFSFFLADFFQFLAACCQANAMKKIPGRDEDADYTPPDFMNNKTWLDFTKVYYFFITVRKKLEYWCKKIDTIVSLLFHGKIKYIILD